MPNTYVEEFLFLKKSSPNSYVTLYITVNLRTQVSQRMAESLFYKLKPLPEQMLGNIIV